MRANLIRLIPVLLLASFLYGCRPLQKQAVTINTKVEKNLIYIYT